MSFIHQLLAKHPQPLILSQYRYSKHRQILPFRLYNPASSTTLSPSNMPLKYLRASYGVAKGTTGFASSLGARCTAWNLHSTPVTRRRGPAPPNKVAHYENLIGIHQYVHKQWSAQGHTSCTSMCCTAPHCTPEAIVGGIVRSRGRFVWALGASGGTCGSGAPSAALRLAALRLTALRLWRHVQLWSKKKQMTAR